MLMAIVVFDFFVLLAFFSGWVVGRALHEPEEEPKVY